MRRFAAISLVGSCLISAGFAHCSSSTPVQKPLVLGSNQNQVPLVMSETATPVPSGDPIISDVLGRERKINIFTGLIRDVDSVSKRLHDDSLNTTILAPLNAELTKLPTKPWEDPRDYHALGVNAYEGNDGQSRAQRNLQSFVEAHIVPKSPWQPGMKISTLAGTTLQLEEKDGKRYIQPGNIEVESVADTVANGQVWIIQGVLDRQ